MDLLEKHVLPKLLETFPKLGDNLHLTVRASAWPGGCLGSSVTLKVRRALSAKLLGSCFDIQT